MPHDHTHDHHHEDEDDFRPEKPDLPRLIGHRGLKSLAPENTLAGIALAKKMGFDWVEFDVKLTADDVPILFHDDTLERTTNGIGKVTETKWADIRELDAGGNFSEEFLGEAVPSFEQALELLIDLGMGCNVELKPCTGREVETAAIALDIMSRVWDEDCPLPLISSFKFPCLETAKEIIPSWPRGVLFSEYDPEWLNICNNLQATAININGNTATQDQIEAYLNADLMITAWTVNDVQTAKRLLQWGVDAIISDQPHIIEENL